MGRRLHEMIEKVRDEVDTDKVGMIACHNGIVRGTSRDGHPAEYLEIERDERAWAEILADLRAMPGISVVEADLCEGRRQIGDDVLLVVVAGDIRENVFAALEAAVNRFKGEAIIKREKLRETRG